MGLSYTLCSGSVYASIPLILNKKNFVFGFAFIISLANVSLVIAPLVVGELYQIKNSYSLVRNTLSTNKSDSCIFNWNFLHYNYRGDTFS